MRKVCVNGRFLVLPQDVRRIIEKTARATQRFVWATAEEIDKRLLHELEAAGMQINEPDRESFARASQSIYAEFGAAVPGASGWIEHALALAAR